MGYNLLINGVYWGYNPLTNHLLTSWDIQVHPLSHPGQQLKVLTSREYLGDGLYNSSCSLSLTLLFGGLYSTGNPSPGLGETGGADTGGFFYLIT